MPKETKKKAKNTTKKTKIKKSEEKGKNKKTKNVRNKKTEAEFEKNKKEAGRDKKKKPEKNKYLAEWTAPEFVKTKEETFWYYISIGASALMILWSLYQRNFIVIITFLLLIIVVAFQIYHRPKDIKYKIGLKEIIAGEVIYRYDDIKSFEVIQGDDYNVLKFRLKNAIFPVKEIQLADQNPYYIRAALEYFLPEEEQKEALLEFEKRNNIDDEYMSNEDFYEYLKKERGE